MSTTFGQKLRLNVVALISETTVGRLLVCIDDEALVEDLASKVRGALAKSAVPGRLLRLTNHFGANLPSDEKVGDVLRDAEEVVAVLVAEPDDPAVRQQLAGGVGEIMSFARAGPPRQEASGPSPGIQVQRGDDRAATALCGGDESFQTALPSSPRGQQRAQLRPEPASGSIPGPVEMFEEDLLELPAVKGGMALATRLPSGSDWTVNGLSPKLREYITTRFREANVSAAEPGNSFIAVSMQPRARAGAVPNKAIHYSIARVDVIEFERLCDLRVQETRSRADHFRRCQQVLNALVDKGTPVTEYAKNMLPYSYRGGEQLTDLLSETDMPTFGQVEGFRPTIVIDNSGVVGETLPFIKAAMKRILYSFLVSKSKFNLLKFSPQGKPMAWANGMVPPTSQVLREAEEFLDGMKPVRNHNSANLLEAIQMAMSHPDADVVYVLTSGLPKRSNLDAAMKSLRSMNYRDLPLHIVGVECEPKAELELRRIAEDNHGSFRHKRFSSSGSSSRPALDMNSGLGNDDARLTIDGQLTIIEVMLEEHDRHTVDWLEEQKCANRLLLTTASQQPVPDAEQAHAIYQRAAIRNDARQGGFSQSRLQELVDAHVRAPSPFSQSLPAPATGSMGHGAERRRVAAHASRRASSQPRPAETMRRPSVVNPWDRPGGVIKTSQLTSKGLKGSGPFPPRAGRPQSARARPGSAARADSARRPRM